MELVKELTKNPLKTASRHNDKFIGGSGFVRAPDVILPRFMIGPRRRRKPNTKLVAEMTSSEPKNINALLIDSMPNYYSN